MHGKEVHESRRTNRCHPSEEGLRRDEPSDWRELQSEPEGCKRAHQLSKSKGTDAGGGIYPTSEGMAAEGSGQQVRKNVDRPMAFAAFGAGSSARPEKA